MLPERFLEKTAEDPSTGCWNWTGSSDRYGFFYWQGKTVRAHRFAYEREVGEVPDGLELDHTCRNTHCVNPAHLEPVTHAENVARGDLGRARREQTHCKRGHELSDDNVYIHRNKKGWVRRQCKICRREIQRRFRERRWQLK